MVWKVERWLADVFPGEANVYSEYKDLPPRELAIVAAAVLDSALAEILALRLRDNNCPSSKQMGLLSVFHKGGSGASLFDVKPLGFDGSSGGFGWSVF